MRMFVKFTIIILLVFVTTSAVVMAGGAISGEVLAASCTTESATLAYVVLTDGSENIDSYTVGPNGLAGIGDLPDTSSFGVAQYPIEGVESGNEVTIDVGFGNTSLDVARATCSRAKDKHDAAFNDGRINDYDAAAPVAVFPYSDGGETGIQIYDVDGVLLVTITPKELSDAVASGNSGNVLVVSVNGVALQRLANGLWQINAPQYNGKTYVLIFKELFPGGGYESYELES